METLVTLAPVREVKAADVEEPDYGKGASAVIKATYTLVSPDNNNFPRARSPEI